MTESWILCEGYHDRGFWAGWLTYLGCSDVGFRRGTPGYPTRDPGETRSLAANMPTTAIAEGSFASSHAGAKRRF